LAPIFGSELRSADGNCIRIDDFSASLLGSVGKHAKMRQAVVR